MKMLSILIVNHNHNQILEQCLREVILNTSKIDCEIFLVDNNSKQNIFEKIKYDFPQISLITNKQNIGFGAANNKAFSKSKGKYILILNPDVFVQPNSIEKLIEFMDSNYDAGIVCPKLLNIDKSLQYSCRAFYKFHTLLFRRTILGKIFPNHYLIKEHLMHDWDHNNVKKIDWAIGACMLIRRRAVASNKIFDDRYFMYFEDVDLCYQMKIGGWNVYYNPNSVMIHHHIRHSAKKGFNRAKFEHLKSFIKFCLKYKGRLDPETKIQSQQKD